MLIQYVTARAILIRRGEYEPIGENAAAEVYGVFGRSLIPEYVDLREGFAARRAARRYREAARQRHRAVLRRLARRARRAAHGAREGRGPSPLAPLP